MNGLSRVLLLAIIISPVAAAAGPKCPALGPPSGISLDLMLDLLLGPSALVEPADDEPEADHGALKRALGTLKARKATTEDKDAAIDVLLALGIDGPRSLASFAAKESARLHSKNEKAIKKLVKSVEKRASAILKKRLDREVLADLEKHRAVIMRNSRNQSLTKETIQAESDPALAALKKHLSVTMDQIWEADEKLFESYTDLLDGLVEESKWVTTWVRARDAVAGHPDGARAAERLKAPDPPEYDVDGLVARLQVSAELATPMGADDRRILLANAALKGQIGAEELEGIRVLNMMRVLIGLGVQKVDVKLCAAGRGHSQDMVENKFFSHTSVVPGKERPGQRASLAGTSSNAENIARGADTGAAVIKQWWYSPGHHRNMLHGQGRTGLGRFDRYWTQMFG